MTAVRIVIGVACAALLTSMGGAGIYAAPLTLPLLWLAAWQAGQAGKTALNAVAALTAAEVAWAAGYSLGGPAEWLLPLGALAAVAVAYPLTQRAGRRHAVPAAA